MTYNKIINGIRGYSVLLVVFFHFSIVGFDAGFIGVDLFFLISGYLMTGIIFSDNRFSYIRFIIRRCHRIVIPLLALALICVLLSFVFSFKGTFYEVLSSAKASILFYSNFLYWFEAGYFDSSSHEKLLLHTWSLSVEWQFYCLYPIIIIYLNRFFSLSVVKSLLLLLAIVIFMISGLLSYKYPSASFYLLPTRSWEMLIGGYLYLLLIDGSLKSFYREKIIFYIGLLLIIFSMFVISSDSFWPGYLSILPIMGVFLVIFSSYETFITNNKFIQYIGKTSYSIYLVHWPVYVVFNSVIEDGSEYIYTYSLLVFSVVLGVLFYYVFERGLTSYVKSKLIGEDGFVGLLKYVTLIFVVIIIFSILDHLYSKTSGIRPSSHIQKENLIEYYKDLHWGMDSYNRRDCNFYNKESKSARSGIPKECTYPLKDKKIFIWGDSHAQSLNWGLNNVFSDYSILQVATSGCPVAIGKNVSTKLDNNCNLSNRYAYSEIKRVQPDLVIISQASRYLTTDFEKIANELKKLGVTRVIFVGPIHRWYVDLPLIVAKRHWDQYTRYLNGGQTYYLEDRSLNKRIFEVDVVLKRKLSNSASLEYISLVDYMCQNQRSCIALVPDEESLLQVDESHLSPAGSVYVSDIIKKYINNAKRNINEGSTQ